MTIHEPKWEGEVANQGLLKIISFSELQALVAPRIHHVPRLKKYMGFMLLAGSGKVAFAYVTFTPGGGLSPEKSIAVGVFTVLIAIPMPIFGMFIAGKPPDNPGKYGVEAPVFIPNGLLPPC